MFQIKKPDSRKTKHKKNDEKIKIKNQNTKTNSYQRCKQRHHSDRTFRYFAHVLSVCKQKQKN